MIASNDSARGAVPDARRAPREFLEHLYRVAVERALPLASMGAHLPAPPAKGRTLVLGAGKAGGSMAQALDALWPADAPLSGLVVRRYHHIPPRPAGLPKRIELVEAAHPVPDEAGLKAAERILALTDGLTADDLVLCLISGGGSALLTLPAEGLTLADKQRINNQLLESGAHIGEMNCVRKHLSRVKGGRLAAACAPAKVVTLTISDVPGDDPAVIASGPTVPDATTCAGALAILDRYRIEVPPAVRARLESGELETPQPGDGVFGGHAAHLIATPQQSLEAAATAARAAGIEAHILSDEMEGVARGRQGARGAGARGGPPRRALRQALRDPVGWCRARSVTTCAEWPPPVGAAAAGSFGVMGVWSAARGRWRCARRCVTVGIAPPWRPRCWAVASPPCGDPRSTRCPRSARESVVKVDAVIAARHDKSLPCVIALEAVIAEVRSAITGARRLFGSSPQAPDGIPHWTRRLTCSPRKRTAHRRDGRAVWAQSYGAGLEESTRPSTRARTTKTAMRRRRAARLRPGGDHVGTPQRNRGLARRRLHRDQCARLPAMRRHRHGAARSGTRQSSDKIGPVTPRGPGCSVRRSLSDTWKPEVRLSTAELT